MTITSYFDKGEYAFVMLSNQVVTMIVTSIHWDLEKGFTYSVCQMKNSAAKNIFDQSDMFKTKEDLLATL